MASKTQDALFEEFQEIRPQSDMAPPGLLESEYGVVSTISQMMAGVNEVQKGNTSREVVSPGDVLTGVEQYTPSPTSTARPSDSSSIAGTALSVASKVFESGLGLVPLVSGLLGLFGGGGSTSPPPLQKYAMPEHLSFTGADTGSGFGEADFDRFGMPRLYDPLGASETSGAGQNSPPEVQDWPTFGSSFGTGYSGSRLDSGGTSNLRTGAPFGGAANNSNGSALPAPQISVNIQAMDTQSFLDHSDEIAQAVRQAMLSLNSINDVMNDL